MNDLAALYDKAACRDYPLDWWFPTVGENAPEARAICRSCPVRRDCLEFALTAHIAGSFVEGIWASTCYRERRELRRQRAAKVG